MSRLRESKQQFDARNRNEPIIQLCLCSALAFLVSGFVFILRKKPVPRLLAWLCGYRLDETC